jgi:hypothetical protein
MLKANDSLSDLDDVRTEPRSVVIEKRGTPKGYCSAFREHVKLAPEPEVLKLIGDGIKA